MARKSLLILAVTALLASPALVLAGEGGTGEQPPPSGNDGSGGGSTIGGGFNPLIYCDTTGGLVGAFECLADEVANPPVDCEPLEAAGGNSPGPGGADPNEDLPRGDCPQGTADASDFDTWVGLGGHSFFVFKKEAGDDGSIEVDRLLMWEDDTGVQTLFVDVDRPDRVARIRLLDKEPAGDGPIVVLFNDVTVASVDTVLHGTSVEVNFELFVQIRNAGYDVFIDRGYMYAKSGDGISVPHIRRLEFQARDSGITVGEIGLVEPDNTDFGLVDGRPGGPGDPF